MEIPDYGFPSRLVIYAVLLPSQVPVIHWSALESLQNGVVLKVIPWLYPISDPEV